MPRTTLDLDGQVLKELKRRSHREGKTAGQLASELLAEVLGATKAPVRPLRWRSAMMGARVDLEDKDALARLLDE